MYNIPVSITTDSASSADDRAYRLTLVAAGFNASEITIKAQKNTQTHRKQQDVLRTGESTRLKARRSTRCTGCRATPTLSVPPRGQWTAC